MIQKIGIDIVENKRMGKLIKNRKFLERILSVEEINIYDKISNPQRKIEYAAGRFASKEAIVKVLPKTYHNYNYCEMNILNHEDGSPYFSSHKINENIQITISHTHSNTIACALLNENNQ